MHGSGTIAPCRGDERSGRSPSHSPTKPEIFQEVGPRSSRSAAPKSAASFQPGWRWSNDVKPIARTSSCEAPHFQCHVSGRLAIRMDDGTEFIAGPGDITSLPSGHDAWVVGNEPVVVVDWFGASNYAKRS